MGCFLGGGQWEPHVHSRETSPCTVGSQGLSAGVSHLDVVLPVVGFLEVLCSIGQSLRGQSTGRSEAVQGFPSHTHQSLVPPQDSRAQAASLPDSGPQMLSAHCVGAILTTARLIGKGSLQARTQGHLSWTSCHSPSAMSPAQCMTGGPQNWTNSTCHSLFPMKWSQPSAKGKSLLSQGGTATSYTVLARAQLELPTRPMDPSQASRVLSQRAPPAVPMSPSLRAGCSGLLQGASTLVSSIPL